MQIRFLRVARAIASLDPDKTYPRASSEDATYLHQLGAAQQHGMFEPYCDEARELNDWLMSVRAGRALCREVWDAFMAQAPKTEPLRAPAKAQFGEKIKFGRSKRR
jgi:hypothetical protein